MKLSDLESALLPGEHGVPRQRAIARQVEVGWFFDARDFVEINQAHLMADTESLGEEGVAFLKAPPVVETASEWRRQSPTPRAPMATGKLPADLRKRDSSSRSRRGSGEGS